MQNSTLLNKQILLANTILVARKRLSPPEFEQFNPSNIKYRVSGSTDIADYAGQSYHIQSYVYDDNTEKTIILCGGFSYEYSSKKDLTLGEAIESLAQINEQISNDELEDNESIARRIEAVTEGLKNLVHATTGFNI